MKTILMASDHAGFNLKARLIQWAETKEYTIEDLGTYTEDPVDYPDYAQKLALRLQYDSENMGVLICGTGTGIAMAANRFPWVRAAVGNHSLESVQMARAHNDANVLCLGARLIKTVYAQEALDVFLKTPFEGGRHQQRLEKLKCLDGGHGLG